MGHSMTTPDPSQQYSDPTGNAYPTAAQYAPAATGAYPPVGSYPSPGGYPSADYQNTGGYPTTGYPATGYPTTGYPALPDPHLPTIAQAAGYAQQPMAGYPAPTYAAGFPGAYPVAARNGMGTAALVVGIIAVVMCWNFLGIVLGVLAIIFGGVGLGRANRGEANNRGAAMTGLILGIVALVLLVVLVVAVIGTVGFGLSHH